MMAKEVLNVSEAAEYLGVASGTLRNWCSQRRVPYQRIGGRVVFVRERLDRWIDENSVEPIGASARK